MYTHMRSVIELFAFATDLLATTEIALNIILKRAKLNAIGGQKPSPHPHTEFTHKTKAHRDEAFGKACLILYGNHSAACIFPPSIHSSNRFSIWPSRHAHW